MIERMKRTNVQEWSEGDKQVTYEEERGLLLIFSL